MKKRSIFIFAILIFTLNLSVFAQVELKDFPKKPETGDCFMKNLNDTKWILIDCELAKIFENKELKILQYKWQKLGYNVDTSGCIDKKTIFAFNKEKNKKKVKARKDLKLQKRGI